jgi:uncharacterized protein
VKYFSDQLRLSATDVSNHLACSHLTNLELSVAQKKRTAPDWASPDLIVIRELGIEHEKEYIAFLKQTGLEVVDLQNEKNDSNAVEKTLQAMRRGADVIYQGA